MVVIDTLRIVRGTYQDLISNIDKYPEFSPVFSTDTKQFFIKFQDKLQSVTSTGIAISSIAFEKIENGITYYVATMNDGSTVSFPFLIKFDINKIPENELFRMKSDGTAEGSGIVFEPGNNRYNSRYSFKFPSGSIWIGENIKLSENGGFVQNTTKSLGKTYIMLDYENDPIKGSDKPLYYERSAMETKVEIQKINSQILDDITTFSIGNPSYDREIQAIYFDFINPVANLRLEIVVNGKAIAHFPSENAWNGFEPGLALGTGVQRIEFNPNFTNLVEYDFTMNLKADGQIDLKGNGNVPWYALDLNKITRKYVMVENDVNDDVVSFRHSLAVKAMNKTGRIINARNFVMLLPKANGRFNMIPITKTTKYKGEIIGIVEEEVAVSEEGQVNIITNYQTGVSGVSEGVPAYVGFSSLEPTIDTIDIMQKDMLAQEFGKCGVFGGTNSLGEYMANFNSFEVQAYYAVQSHHDADIDYHDNLPGVIDKEALFVYLVDEISAGGIVEQQLPQLSTVEKGMQIYVNNKSISPLSKIRLLCVGDDKINGASTYEVEGGDTKMMFIATVNGWVKFFDSTSVGGSDPDLTKKVASNTAELDRLKTQIRTSILPTFSFRGPGIPTTLTSGYKAYYIHSIVLQDSLQTIDIPQNLADGTILSIENNDRTDYLSLRPAAGETINGKTGIYQCGHDTLNFFVKNNDDWTLAYGGIFPNSLSSLKTTIEALLPNDLNTISEISAQLKDRLHTFREIQNEFSSQLHTLEEIAKDMESKGFTKESGKIGMQGDQSVPISDSWSIKDFKSNEEFILPAQNKGNQFLVFSLPVQSASVVGKVIINNEPAEFSEYDFVDNELHYKVFISNDKVDSSQTIRFKIDYKVESDIMVHWGLSDTNSVTTDSWMMGKIYANEHVVPPIQSGTGLKFLIFRVPIELFPVIDGVYVGQDLIEFTAIPKAVDTFNYRTLITTTEVDLSSTKKVVLNYDFRGSHVVSGITIDDGITNKAGIKTVNIEGAYLSKVFDDSDQVTLTCATEFEQQGGVGGGRVNKVYIENPLNSYLDPDTKPGEPNKLKLGITHGYFELSKPPGYLAYLSENEEVIGRNKVGEAEVRTAPIWFDDLVVGEELGFLEIDKPNKAIGVQDYTDDDPNVTGGVPTLIVFRAACKGKAPNDGFIELLLKKTDEGTPVQNGDYLLNADGNPIGIRKGFKSGDDLGVLEAAAIYIAKGITKFQCILEHNFVDDNVLLEDRTEGGSCLLIQALGKEYATGDALLQFENDTMQNIQFSKHYNGKDIFNMAWALGYDRADVDINAGNGQTSIDGLHFYNNTNLKVGVADKTIHIHDNGTDMCYFSLGQIFSAEKTLMLQGKDLDVKVTLQDKKDAYKIYMVKWSGSPDKYTDKIIDRFDADQGAIPEANWSLEGSVFITEDPLDGEHDFAGTLTVPVDATNFAVVIVPLVKQDPVELYMKAFEIDVSEPFYGWILKAPELIGEKHLQFDPRHKELRCDLPSTLGGIRYTLNNVPSGMPMPIGIPKSGKADIEIDHTINQVSGSSLPQFEGAIKFLKEGKATIQTDLYIHSEISHGVLATTKFWYSKVSSDGQTFTKIPLSEYTTQVSGQTKAINKMPKFKIDVQPNDRIALFGTSDQSDGAFISTADSHIPMLKTIIDFDEITAEEKVLLDKLTHAEEVLFVDNGVPVEDPSKYKLKIDVKTGETSIEEV